jgi:hypothetical protein
MSIVLRATARTGLPKIALPIAAMVFSACPPAPALATTEMDCPTIGREALEVDLTTAASDVRHIVLRSGEVLRFTFEAEPGPFGSLTLIEGDAAPRLLLVGPSGTGVSFTARHSGAFGFQFARDGSVAARFTVACVQPPPAPAGKASARVAELRHGGLPLHAGDMSADEVQVSALDATMSGLDMAGLASKDRPAAASRDPGVTAPQAGTGPHIKLQWLEQRYRGAGHEGPQVDARASGIEIGMNYTLKSAITVGALAQVNPAEEVLLGAQRSLIDQGWMAGPFTTIQLAPGLILDARAAWGEGQRGPDDAAAAAAQRRLIAARLANAQSFGDWRFTPSVNLNYLQETAPGPEAAADAHALAAGRLDMGPEIVYHTELTPSAFIEPRVVVGGFWNLDSLAEPAGGQGPADMRLRAEAGVTIGIHNGPKLQALGALEEGDEAVPDTWSGRLQFNVPLQ